MIKILVAVFFATSFVRSIYISNCVLFYSRIIIDLSSLSAKSAELFF